jgi:hypothetical protein
MLKWLQWVNDQMLILLIQEQMFYLVVSRLMMVVDQIAEGFDDDCLLHAPIEAQPAAVSSDSPGSMPARYSIRCWETETGPMANYVGNKELVDELSELNNGIHQAMEALIREKDYTRAGTLLAEVDVRMAKLRQSLRLLRLS